MRETERDKVRWRDRRVPTQSEKREEGGGEPVHSREVGEEQNGTWGGGEV